MKLAEAAVLGLLAAGCPMLLFASTLKADLSYRIDTISQPGKLLLPWPPINSTRLLKIHSSVPSKISTSTISKPNTIAVNKPTLSPF